MNQKNPKSSLRVCAKETALFGMLGTMTFCAKLAMSGIPNIEPVSLLVMLYAVVLGWKALYPIYLYVLLEILFYGVQLWNLHYLYVWAVLALAARLLRRTQQSLTWALLSGCFGLLFGALCAPVYLVAGGPSLAFNWWIAGLPYDVLHGAGNFAVALGLFAPLRKLLESLYQKLAR